MSIVTRQRNAVRSRLLIDAIRGEDWMDQAACRPSEGIDRDIWHDDRYIASAQKVCAGCPVAGPCRQFAERAGDDWGIYAGTTAGTRRTARRPVARSRRRCNFCRNLFTPVVNERYCGDQCRHRATHAANSAARRPELDRHLPAIRRMARLSYDDQQIAAAIGLRPDQVQYLRRRERIPAGRPVRTRERTAA